MKEDKTGNIAVLMACHNRRSHTLECLRALRDQSVFSQMVDERKYTPSLWLLDDASRDSTAEAVKTAWPDANIVTGDGKRYWCGGMREAWKHAALADPDYYLLMNDDTTIASNALEELLALAPTPENKVIAVAAITDPRSGKVVFGGHKGHNLAPVQPSGKPEECDTMNANCALVPRAVYRALGGLNAAYTHSMGDFDYGFKASRHGVKVIQSPSSLGYSEQNDESGSWRDASLSRPERLKLLWFSHTKGLPFLEWCAYCLRNHGWRGPYKCFSPTVRVLLGR